VIELEALRQASLTLTASLDLQDVLDAILACALELFLDAQDAHIFLYEDDKLIFQSALWSDGRKGQAWANPRPDGLTYTVARQGELIYVDDMRTHPLFTDTPESWIGAIIGLPLKIRERVLGVMTVAHAEVNAFSEDDIRVLRLLGDQAAIAIENARLHDLVNQQALTDMLTGLPNRRALDERLASELKRSRRYQREFSIVMMDLDSFKSVNDRYGHLKGDMILKKIAEHMGDTTRAADFLARFGGDEFALLLPETDFDTAYHMASRLQEAIQVFCRQLEGIEGLEMGVSFGCATYPQHGDDIETLLNFADRSLYHSKGKKE
jgi:diguanylate cyclase (GGDEF)-like protein